jgi:hypothetical protein
MSAPDRPPPQRSRLVRRTRADGIGDHGDEMTASSTGFPGPRPSPGSINALTLADVDLGTGS